MAPSKAAGAGKAPAASATPLMSSDEVNLLVYSYLAESALEHSAFTLYNESRLGDFINEDGTNPAAPPTGHLIKILQKGLLYLQAESKYRGEDLGPGNVPRLIGYNIPDSLPLPPIPRSLPPPPAQSTSSTSNNASTQPVSPALPSESTSTTATSQKQQVNGSSDKVKNKRANNGSAVAGPSGTSGNSSNSNNAGTKRKDTAAAEDGQSVNKKLKTAKSPTNASSNDTIQDGGSSNINNEEMGPPSLSSSTKNNKKGKGKAVNTDQQGDSEMADANSSTTNNTPAQASQKEKGPLARAVAAAANATSRALPSAFSSNNNTSSSSQQPNGTSSTSTFNSNNLTKSHSRPSSPNLPTNSNASTTRRSSSPHVNRSSAGAAAAASKNRPRSTSPNISLRTSQSASSMSINTSSTTAIPELKSLSSTRKTGSSDTASTTHSGPLQTPTLDASGIPATNQSKDSKDGQGMKVEDLPKMIPKNIVKDEKVLKLKGHTMPVQPCHWNPKVETLLATGAGDSTMRIWDVPIDQPDKAVEPITCKHASGQRRSDVTTVEWNSDGTLLATGSDDGIARIWTPSGDLHLVLSMHQRTIFTIKWNSKGTMLLTGSLDHSICLWESQYGKMKSQWSSHSDSVLDLDWMTDEIFASCSMDKNIHVHHVNKSSPVYRFKGHSDEVNCLRFDPSKRLLASCSDDCSVRIWSLKPVKNVLGIKSLDGDSSEVSPKKEDSGDEKPSEPMCLVLKGHKKEVHAVAWSPCSDVAGEPKILASASFDCTARLWDVNTGACLHIINRHTDMAYSLSFQPILGEYLATGGNDSRMCITRVKDKELVYEYMAKGAVYEVLWHPTRNQVAVCGKSEVVSVVNFELEDT